MGRTVVTLTAVDGSGSTGAADGAVVVARLADGRLAAIAPAGLGTDVPRTVLVDGVPHEASVVSSGRAHAEAAARLAGRRGSWLRRRRRPGPVLLLVPARPAGPR